MRSILFIVGICILILGLSETSFAKAWKGILPLKTTRAEVVKLLGPSTGTDEYQRAIFAHSDGIVKISWKRPDCVSKDFLWSDKEADDKALVYQITVEPKADLKSIEEYEKPEPPKEKEDIKTVYRRWLDQDVNCLMGEGSSSCSFSNDRTGFGYSHSSKSGVTAIYYFATKEETEAFLSARQPCVIKAETNGPKSPTISSKFYTKHYKSLPKP
jgi:hypothetical protein